MTELAKPTARPHRRKGRRGAPKPSGGAVGRESKLTEAKVTAIAERIAEGMPLDTAAAASGVSPRAAKYWLAMARQLVERVPKPKSAVTGEEPEAVSPWPRLPATLLVHLLHAIDLAHAQDEQRRIEDITLAGHGGAVTFEKIEETTHPTTGVIKKVTARSLAAPDWRAHMELMARRDPERWGRATREPAAALPPFGSPAGLPGGEKLSLHEVTVQAWILIGQAKDPRALPPATIEGESKGNNPVDSPDGVSEHGA